jgi:hypothetical protein
MTLGCCHAHPREVRSSEVRFWERWPPVVCEKEREKREATVGGLNTPESALDWTLSDRGFRVGIQTHDYFD